jgi:acid stress-induced BolA-like protein IbaG/YrbA
MLTPEQLQAYIGQALTCNELRISGDGQHFEAVIVSEAFRGKSRVQRHQLVYQALGDRMREEIHALSMRTMTPEEWSEARG